MGIVIIPPMKKLLDDTTQAQRKELYKEYYRELLTLNPHLFNIDGSHKSIWQWLRDLFTCRDDGI